MEYYTVEEYNVTWGHTGQLAGENPTNLKKKKKKIHILYMESALTPEQYTFYFSCGWHLFIPLFNICVPLFYRCEIHR